MGAAAGVFCAGYLSSRIGSRVVCTAVFLLCGLGRAAVATLASLETSGVWADTRTPNRLRALLTILLGAVSESQWVMMNALVQTALLGHPAVARASGNAAYRLTNAVGSVLTPLAVTQVPSTLPSHPLRLPCTSPLHPPTHRLVSSGAVHTHLRSERASRAATTTTSRRSTVVSLVSAPGELGRVAPNGVARGYPSGVSAAFHALKPVNGGRR